MGSVSVSSLAISGGAGFAFTIPSLTGTFDLASGVDLSGDITIPRTTSARSGLLLRFSESPGPVLSAPRIISRAILPPMRGAQGRWNVSTPTITRSVPACCWRRSGPIRAANLGSLCTAPASLSYDCDTAASLGTAPFDPYSLTEFVELSFGIGTAGKTEHVENEVNVNHAIPEPKPLA
jgi:hypothetical protein